MNPEIHLALHRARTAELRAAAEAHRLAATAAQPRQDIRTRLGWTLVTVGLRLATPRPVLSSWPPRPYRSPARPGNSPPP